MHDLAPKPRIVTATVSRLPHPPASLMVEARVCATTEATHERLTDEVPAFHALEAQPLPTEPQLGPQSLVVAAWNAERLKYAEPSAALVHGIGADVLLLTETDIGMARSGNRHTTADLAASLGMGYVYGLEFLELGIGDKRERVWHAGETNAAGFHGNAILSRLPLSDPALIRLDDGAAWWIDAWDDQRRLGWRNAIAARVQTTDGPVLVVCVHLESKSDASDRGRQTRRLLEAVETLAKGDPVVIGGDFNTVALPLEAPGVSWLAAPDQEEPLFSLMANSGFDWRGCNTDVVSMRTRPDGTPEAPFRRIDWMFTRGLSATRAVTVAAVDGAGSALSDHELIMAEIAVLP